MANDSKINNQNREENELMLELSIGGIFGNPNRTSPNVNELKEIDNELNVEESKLENQAGKRRELRRKREEKSKKTVCFGSVSGPFVENKEWLETQVIGQNDDVLDVEHVRKKERIVEDGNENGKKCVFTPTVCRSFWPCNDDVNVKGSGGEDEMESGGGRRNCKLSSNGSGGGGSSAYSDGQCSSHQGGATDDSRSISSNSQLDQQLPSTSTTSDQFDQSDQPTSSPKQTVPTNKITDPTISDPNSLKPNYQLNRHASSVSNPPSKLDTSSSQHQQASVLARMPCVSTTGNGPNGKTISGFLYRYTKNDVSIVCVCHGHSFSPAGFVEHAGGVNIAHPLKHITISPTTFAS
ncbi:uncharacterized protein [Rutidosis leptorrhynchoides]|uniref:uncharacterized protein n=1 Tax=Rutidosis leptorrhynchoides TaxID=125765 RepID=UPI003A992DF0